NWKSPRANSASHRIRSSNSFIGFMPRSPRVLDRNPWFGNPGAAAFGTLGRFVELSFREDESAGAAFRRFDHCFVIHMLETAKQVRDIIGNLSRRFINA